MENPRSNRLERWLPGCAGGFDFTHPSKLASKSVSIGRWNTIMDGNFGETHVAVSRIPFMKERSLIDAVPTPSSTLRGRNHLAEGAFPSQTDQSDVAPPYSCRKQPD